MVRATPFCRKLLNLMDIMLLTSALGDWKNAASIPDYDLYTLEERLEGDGNENFLSFLRRMLRWLPEERASAKDLLFDPWLMHGLFK